MISPTSCHDRLTFLTMKTDKMTFVSRISLHCTDVRGAAAAVPVGVGGTRRDTGRGRARPAAARRETGRASRQTRQDRQEQAGTVQKDHC